MPYFHPGDDMKEAVVVHSMCLIKDSTNQRQVFRYKAVLTPFYFKTQQILCGLADVKSDGL